MSRIKIRKSIAAKWISLCLSLLFLIEPVTVLNPFRASAFAEKKAATKVAVATVDDASGVKVKDVALKLSDALYLAFAQSGLYDIASKEKVAEAITSAGAAGSKEPSALAKIGKAASADIVFSATLKSIAFPKDKPECFATVYAQAVNTETGDVVAKVEVMKSSGVKPGYSGNQEFLTQEAINMAASAVVDEFFKYQTTESTVLSTRDNKYIVSLGRFQGINSGAEFTVVRKKQPVAVLKITKVNGNDSEGILLTKKPGPPVVAGDTAKILYNPPKSVSLSKEGVPKKKKSWTTLAIGIAVIGAAALLLGKKKETSAPEEPVPTVTGVNATSQGDNKIKVTWNAVTYSKLASYVVYRAEDDGSGKLKAGTFVCAGEVPPGLTFFEDEGKTCDGTGSKALVKGKTYWYQVGVKTTTGQVGGLSPVDDKQKDIAVVAGSKPKANPPTVNPPKAGGKKVTLSWTPPTTRADAAATQLLSSEISGYYVYYSTTQGTFANTSRTFVAHTVGATTISVVLDQNNSIVNTNNVTYYFAVSTVDTDTQEGAQSNAVSATPSPSSPPKAPAWTKVCAANITNITTGDVDDPNCSLIPKSSEVQLTWNAVTLHKDGTCYKGATGCTFSPYEDLLSGYKVYRTESTTLVTDRSLFSVVQTVTPQAGQTVVYSDRTVTNDTTYFYYVRALNDEGTESDLPADNTDILGPVKPQTPTGGGGGGQTQVDVPPKAPTNVSATGGIGKVTLRWDANSETDLDGYFVYQSTSSFNPQTGFTKVTPSPIQDITKAITGLTNGVTYYFYVTAVDKSGGTEGLALESQPSAVVAGIPQPPVPPAAPIWASGTPPDPKPIVPATGSVTLNWKTVTADVNGGALNSQEAPLAKYRVYRSVASDFSTGANGDYTQLVEVTSPTISYKDTTASDPAKFYFYRIQAVLTDGTAGPLSEYRYGQVQQPAIVLYTPDKGSWVVAAPFTVTAGSSSTGCGCVDGNGNGYCDTLDIVPVGGDSQPDDTWYSKYDWKWNQLNYSWNPVEGATRYVLEVAHDANMTSLEKNIVINGQGANNQVIDWTASTCDKGSITSSFPNGTADRPDEVPETTMWWRIKAVNDLGVAFAVSEVRAFTLAGQPLSTVPSVPNAPTALQVQGTPAPSNVTFKWTAPTKNTDGTNITAGTTTDVQLYNIYWSVSADGPFSLISSVLSPTVQFTDVTPVPNFVNYYKVSTVNKGGREGPISSEFVSANIAGLEPAKPTTLAATAGNKSVALTWTAPTTYSDGVTPFGTNDGVLSYTVQRATDINFTQNLTNITGVTTASYNDSGVSNGNTYYYRVNANTKLGFPSAYSDAASATPLNDSPPASPQSFEVAGMDSAAKLSWRWDEASLGADITGFEVWRASWNPADPAPDWTVVSTDPNNSRCQSAGAATICVAYSSCSGGLCTYTDTGLQNGGYYYYWIRSVNKCDQIVPPPASCTSNKSTQTPSTGLRIKGLSNASPTVSPTWGTIAPCLAGPCADTNVGNATVQWDSSGFTPGSAGTPPGIDLSGYFVYAAPLPNVVQSLADSQKGQQTKGVSYYVADIQVETKDVGNPNDNGTGAPYQAIINQFKTDTSAQNMVAGTTYYLAIQGYRYADTDGDSVADKLQYGPLSTILPAQPYSTTVPPAGSFTSSQALNQSTQLTWSATAPNPDDRAAYQILRHDNPPAGCNVAAATVKTVIPVSAGLTSYTDSSLTNGSTYCYWVRVVRKGPSSAAGSAKNCVCNDPSAGACAANPPTDCAYIDSPFVTLVPAASAAPAAPAWANSSVVSTALNGSPALSLTWQTAANATKYRIYRGTSQFGEYALLTACDTSQGGVGTDTKGCYVGAPTTHYIDNDGGAGLDPSTTYYYKLTSVNADGSESAFSDVRWGRPGIDSICTYTPGANKTFVVATGSSPSVAFVWCQFPGAAQYLLEVASDPSITTLYNVQTVATTTATWNSQFTVNNLPPTMYWRISVLDNQNQILTQSAVVAGGQGTFNFQIQ